MYKKICWQENTATFQFVEMFAGQGEATRMFRYADFTSARLDLNYMEAIQGHENPMDLLSSSGMATLGNNY